MKRISSFILAGLLTTSLGAAAQSGDKKEKELESRQKEERSRSLGGTQTESNIPADKSTTNQQQNEDTVSTADNSAASKSVVERNKDQSGTPAKGSAPAVIQRTTSEGGSPSTPPGRDGRDGTNNVQRAKPNIAGAEEPGNMNLGDGREGERNVKTKKPIRKQEQVPQGYSSGQNAESKPAANVKDKSDEENFNTGDKLSKKELRKERRRNRRNNNNNNDDSGS